MDTIARKWPRFTLYFGYASIIIGYIGMIIIAATLVQNVFTLITKPEAAPGVGVVLPIQVKGAFFVPFFYWITSIFIIAVVHEFCHGILARRHDVKVKSGGFLFLSLIVPVIPAAFVEPDEKVMKKRTSAQQISVFAAGPMSNIVMAFIALAILLVIANPITSAIVIDDGVEITGFSEESGPAELAGIQEKTKITHIDGVPMPSVANFSSILKTYEPGTVIDVTTDKGSYNVTLGSNPDNASAAYMGVFIMQDTKTRPEVEEKYGAFLPQIPLWIVTLLYWLWVLNLGIGLFNLVPLGPIDGGRMLDTGLRHFLSEQKAVSIKKVVSIVMFGLILINIGFAFFG